MFFSRRKKKKAKVTKVTETAFERELRVKREAEELGSMFISLGMMKPGTRIVHGADL